MLKKTITYTNLFDEQVTEDFYFNYTKAELADKQYSVSGGLSSLLEGIKKSNDDAAMYDVFKHLILDSYGTISSNGRDFIKTKEQAEAFSHSEPYSILFMEIANDADAAIAFLTGILPKDISKELNVDDIKAEMRKELPAGDR